MRRECQVKNFDGLGPFSYVCRMIHFFEPNTNQSQIETGVEGVEQEEDFSSAYCESSVGDQHYVCCLRREPFFFLLHSRASDQALSVIEV